MAVPQLYLPDGAYGATIFYCGGECGSPNPNTMNDLKSLGCRWWRPQFGWYGIENPQGTYTWTYLDNLVSMANNAGINTVFPIQSPPGFRLTVTGCGSVTLASAADMATFAGLVAARYNGNAGHGIIQAIQIGNEEWETDSCMGINQYTPVVAACVPAIRNAGFNGILVGAAQQFKDDSDIKNWGIGMWQSGAAAMLDVPFDMHYYTGTQDPTYDAGQLSIYHTWQDMQNINAAFGQPYKEMWFTEFGWNLANSNIVTPAQQAQYIVSVYEALRQSGCVTKGFFYTLDAITDPNHLDVSGEPAFTAIQNEILAYPKWDKRISVNGVPGSLPIAEKAMGGYLIGG